MINQKRSPYQKCLKVAEFLRQCHHRTSATAHLGGNPVGMLADLLQCAAFQHPHGNDRGKTVARPDGIKNFSLKTIKSKPTPNLLQL
jgi:hypothetical protein